MSYIVDRFDGIIKEKKHIYKGNICEGELEISLGWMCIENGCQNYGKVWCRTCTCRNPKPGGLIAVWCKYHSPPEV